MGSPYHLLYHDRIEHLVAVTSVRKDWYCAFGLFWQSESGRQVVLVSLCSFDGKITTLKGRPWHAELPILMRLHSNWLKVINLRGSWFSFPKLFNQANFYSRPGNSWFFCHFNRFWIFKHNFRFTSYFRLRISDCKRIVFFSWCFLHLTSFISKFRVTLKILVFLGLCYFFLLWYERYLLPR